MNRRDFLLGSAATVTALSLSEAKDPMIPIIDTHQHLWDLKKVKLNWMKEGQPLARDFVSKDYAEATEGLNVVKAIYMEVDVVPQDQQAEANYVIELIESKKTPTVAAVLGGYPASDGFKKYVDQFKGSKIVKGIRQCIHVDHTPPGFALKKEFIAGVQHLGEIGLSFDLVIRPTDLGDMIKLVEACPGTRFILDHCGNGPVLATDKEREQWKKDMTTIASKKNIVGKVSGIVVQLEKEKGKWKPEALAPVVNHTIEAFGWDRVMFAGDWPVCTLAGSYKDWLTALQTIVKDRTEEQQKKLFHDNAAKFYGV
jgi:predicted TIM-barrel fold metal-dependent hydrolase